MPKAGQIPYSDAISAIALPKVWQGSLGIRWHFRAGGSGSPESHNARHTLSINGVTQQGFFVDVFHKESFLPHVPDKVAFSLVAFGARVLCLDENGVSNHVNMVGKGLPHYGLRPHHPHLHVPVPESCSGYAEPVDRSDLATLWRYFLERANISGGPEFRLPPKDEQQMGLI